MASRYVTRIVDSLLDELVTSFPAISLVGPRAAGKTTTAIRRAATVLRLDDPDVRASVAAAPDAMIAGLPGNDFWLLDGETVVSMSSTVPIPGPRSNSTQTRPW